MNASFLERIFGANFKTTLSAIATALMGALTFVAGLSYDQGPLALVFPPEYKPIITKLAGIATLVLWVYNGIQQKSKNVTGGTIKQSADGSVMAKGDNDVSNLPEFFEVNGIRKRTADASEEELSAVKLAVGSTSIA